MKTALKLVPLSNELYAALEKAEHLERIELLKQAFHHSTMLHTALGRLEDWEAQHGEEMRRENEEAFEEAED